jgi:predicted transport protein
MEAKNKLYHESVNQIYRLRIFVTQITKSTYMAFKHMNFFCYFNKRLQLQK